MKTSTDIPKAPGIYRISIGPRTFYWGQAQSLREREYRHLWSLRKGTHQNRRLQASFSKHGEAAFTFEVSLLCPAEDLNMQEQFVLDIWHGTPGCANVARVAEAPTRGLQVSDETRAKISAAQMGVTRPPETAASIRKGRRATVPNIRVVHTDGREEVWPSQVSMAASLGHKNAGAVGNWLSGHRPIPAKYNIASISRTDLPATINPEAL